MRYLRRLRVKKVTPNCHFQVSNAQFISCKGAIRATFYFARMNFLLARPDEDKNPTHGAF